MSEMKKKTSMVCGAGILFLIGAMVFLGCARQENVPSETAEIFAMDTIMNFTVYGTNSSDVLADAKAMVQKYEGLFSVNVDSSDVAKLNASAGIPVKVSEETYEILQKSVRVSEQTDGLFDVSIYPLVRAWGFTTESYRVPEKKEIQDILKHVDYRNIIFGENYEVTLPKDMQIDLGAIAKGYLSQQLIELFAQKKVTAAVVSLGGNVQTYGKKPDASLFRVGITDPSDGVSVYGSVEVGEKAVITSGSYQRYFEENGKKYHHIMDKRTGEPADSDLQSVTVISDRGETADALATALFIMGKEKAVAFAKEHKEIQLILIDENNQVWHTQDISFIQQREE